MWHRSIICLLLLTGLSSCVAADPAYRDERFVIHNMGDFDRSVVDRVRDQLHAGVEALRKENIPIRSGKFPITVNLHAGEGISASHHGKGPIDLYRLGRKRTPIIHELTHMLAGYTRANGHWSPEGLASYVQDKYGEDFAYPTFRKSHAYNRILIDDRETLPMLEVMRDRRREKYFGIGNLWDRWRAYSQATSFTRYLIESYGMGVYLKLYDRRLEDIDFNRLYGKPAEQLVSEWRQSLKAMNLDLERPQRAYRRMKQRLR